MAEIRVKAYVRERYAENAAKAELGSNAKKGEHFKILYLEDGRFAYQVLKQPPKRKGKAVKPTAKRRAKPKAPAAPEAKPNKFGVRPGTKAAAALALFQMGSTMAVVKKTTGSTHYNLLRRLGKAGHTVTKDEKDIIRVKAKKG